MNFEEWLRRVRQSFAIFDRPECVVVHPGEECYDCPDVADALSGVDCNATFLAESIDFSKLPMDCLNSEAFLHFFPAIANQAIRSTGTGVAEQVAWILGADEWDTEQTISEQIQPSLNPQQRCFVIEVLSMLDALPLSLQAQDNLRSAKEIWNYSE